MGISILKSEQTFLIVVKTILGQLKTKRASPISFHICKNYLAGPFSFQLTQNSFYNNEKSLLCLEKYVDYCTYNQGGR